MEESNNNKGEDNVESSEQCIDNVNIQSQADVNVKRCRSCFQKIHVSATVCEHCGCGQSWWRRHFADIATVVSIVMVIIAATQLFEAFKANIDASNALETAESAAKDVNEALAQVISDANETKRLKHVIENQSATVDLVAQNAAEARKITVEVAERNEEMEKKVVELSKLISKASDKLQELENITEFSKVAIAAQNDDRYAFDKLISLGGDNTFEFWELAHNAAIKVRVEYNNLIEPGYIILNWPESVDPLKLSVEQIRAKYKKSLPLYHTDFVKHTEKNTVIPKKEKMQFFIDILKEDASLTATYYAGKYFIKEANDPELKWTPFSTKPLLDWWEQNKN